MYLFLFQIVLDLKKKKFFINNFPKIGQQKATIYVNLVGKK